MALIRYQHPWLCRERVSIAGRTRMNRIFLLPLMFLALSSSVFTQESATSRSQFMINTERQFLFSCDGTSGSSQLTVRAAREPQGQPILSHRLDADDDCSQAVWTHQMFGPNSSATLVMVNPGRMGLNAQMETFYVDKGVVTPSGNLPVAADKVGSSQFKLYLSETGTKWVRAYEIIRGKLVVSRGLGLMHSGSLCVAPSGEILRTSGCTGKTINAQPTKPLCIEYRGDRGQLKPRSKCSGIVAPRVKADE
jgi:hypothetical protein